MNQEKLYHFFEKSTVAIVIFDAQEGIQYVNQPSLQLFAYEKHHLKSQPFSLLIPSSLHADLESFIESEKKSFYRSQTHLYGSNHLSISADISIQRLSKQDIVPAVYLATIYPIHSNQLPANEREKTNENPFPETQSLLTLLKKETDMPLSTLNTLVDRLLHMRPRSDQMPLLESILHSSHQLQGVIAQVLLYADLLHGRIQTELQPFSFRDLLRVLEDIYYARAQERGIDFKLLAEDDIPTTLVGDAGLIRQMLEKLLNHLFAFTSKRNITVHILLESKIASTLILRFSIIDHEITPKQLLLLKKGIFNKSSKIPQEWAGVELSIVDHLAKQMGGAVNLEYFPINGISIHLTLPLTLVDDTLSKREANLPVDLVQSGHPLQGLRVLYVEDVIPNHFLMEGLCSVWQVYLDTALNGQEALDKLQQNSYDVILMDLQMPVMNGYETSQRIRHASYLRDSAVPIVAVSGSATDETITQIKKHGMNDFLPKPIKPDELYQKLLGFTPS